MPNRVKSGNLITTILKPQDAGFTFPPAFPQAFEPTFYKSTYPELSSHMTPGELRIHYDRHGIVEGRHGNPAASRQGFIALIPPEAFVLEIGPFCSPVIVGNNVRYFDVLDRDGLILRAETLGLPYDRCPTIQYVSPVGDISIVNDRFDAILSCHSIEHHPDLISHLQQDIDCRATAAERSLLPFPPRVGQRAPRPAKAGDPAACAEA